MRKPTADLCDEHGDKVRVLPLDFRDFGGVSAGFSGLVSTVKTENDNTLVRAALETKGEGRVLVVDNGGSRSCAMVGGKLGELARNNGWAGIVVFGCVRDSEELKTFPVGIKALGTCPRKSEKRGVGARDVEVVIAGVTVRVGEWLSADADGVVVSENALG